MYNYKVFLPTAGIGKRVAGYSKALNKGLITIDNKPVLSHIVEKFHPDVPFVIALGHGGDYVKQFLEIAYPDRDFTFVKINKYEGSGSGLGYTVNSCKEYLQCPFIFVSNDTIFEEQLYFDEIYYNWIGYSDILAGNDYRSLKLDNDGNVIKLNDKINNSKDVSYIGISGIKDYKEFWKHMKDDASLIMGESYGIEKMLESIPFNSLKFTWYDTGNESSLNEAKEKLKSKHQPNILEKDHEAIWFVENITVKFSIDKHFIADRVKRSIGLEPFVPTVTAYSDNFYTYDFVSGDILSENITAKKFKYLLSWLDTFWKQKNLSVTEVDNFNLKCLNFYKEKTEERIELYYKKHHNIDSGDEIVNDNKLPSLTQILYKVDWNDLMKGTAVRFHGDLHFENILIKNDLETLPFVLLDWRQNFGNILEYGDMYYDLAKLLHGIIISHDFINQNFYSYNRTMNVVYYDFHRKNSNVECEKILKEYVKSKELSWNKVKVITALIFLNIAGLHHYPYCHLLYYLGKTMLNEEV